MGIKTGILSGIPLGLKNKDRAIIVATLSYFVAQQVLLAKGGTAPPCRKS